ncbi:MAG: helix-turn-helix transcriptional regulator [Verrucomicrobia bacterium]|nr:helix-turn-helix transcriptional regulator [Verrucomicrobiota bacterium]
MISIPHPPTRGELERGRFELHSALDGESVWQASVRLLDLALPYHSCSLLVGIENYRAAESRHHVVAGDYFNFGSAALVSVSGPFLRAHPRIKQYTYSEVIETDPEAPLRRLEKEVTLSAWDQFVHLVFWRRNEPDGLFSVRRTAVQGDFSAAENDFLRQFRTDLGAALQRLRKLQRERSQQAAVQQFVTHLPVPVLFLDGRGKLNFATREAYEQCAVWNHGPVQTRALNPRSCFRLPPEVVAGCEQLLERADGGPARTGETRVIHPSIPGLTATISLRAPLKGPWSCFTFVVTFCSAPVADDSSGQGRPAALRLLNLLTVSERQVALLVAGGERNHDVARRLGKSLRTVEFQLNAIYRKLGIRGRTQLTRLLA